MVDPDLVDRIILDAIARLMAIHNEVGIVTGGIVVYTYTNDEGQPMVGWLHTDNATFSQVLGLVEWVRIEVADRIVNTPPEHEHHE